MAAVCWALYKHTWSLDPGPKMPAAQVYCTSLSSAEFLFANVNSLATRAAEKQVLDLQAGKLQHGD